MKFLLDTNIVSEWVKVRPNPGVVRWLAEADEDRLYVSVMTLAELRHGIARMPGGARRARLDLWLLNEMPARFEGRILLIDREVADCWGEVLARCENEGAPIGAVDALIAATALVRDLTLVTRNVADFKVSLRSILCPWTP